MTTILVEEEVTCCGSASWRARCPSAVVCYFAGGENAGPGGGGAARFSCADPDHKRRAASVFRNPYEYPVLDKATVLASRAEIVEECARRVLERNGRDNDAENLANALRELAVPKEGKRRGE